jgi:hypothetical protein
VVSELTKKVSGLAISGLRKKLAGDHLCRTERLHVQWDSCEVSPVGWPEALGRMTPGRGSGTQRHAGTFTAHQIMQYRQRILIIKRIPGLSFFCPYLFQKIRDICLQILSLNALSLTLHHLLLPIPPSTPPPAVYSWGGR